MKKEKFSYRSSFVDLKNMILFLIVGCFMHIYNHIDETLIKNIEFNTTVRYLVCIFPNSIIKITSENQIDDYRAYDITRKINILFPFISKT